MFRLLHTCLAIGFGIFFSIPFIAAHLGPQQHFPLHQLESLSFPVYHRSSPSIRIERDHDKQRARRVLDLATTSNPISPTPALAAPAPTSADVPTLRSKVVTLSEPFGQYFAELEIGTPAEPLAVIIDTGSQLLWIQCKPCKECGQQVSGYPIFDPAKSSSYVNVMCDASACSAIDGSTAFDCTDSGACEYQVSYGDNSTSSGILATETLTFTKANATSATDASASSFYDLLQFVFGCGVDNEGVETHFNASGLMGLAKGTYSVVSQLNVDVFSYCLPNRENSVDVSGYLTFGKSNASMSASSSSSSSPSLQYTSMLQNNHSRFLSLFYYLNLTGISINNKLLDIPAAALELNTQTGTGGTIIDSGTTLTTFVDEAYKVITQAFDSYVDASLKKVELEENSTTLCYEVPLTKQRGAPVAPTVTLHFEGATVMELSTEHLFHLYGSDNTNNYYCLAMGNSGPVDSGGKNFIGNFQQQNFLVEYDIGNSRVGFAPYQCSPTVNTDKTTPSSHTARGGGGKLSSYLTFTIVLCILFSFL